jgi:DNA-binding transcriptional MerR regulator
MSRLTIDGLAREGRTTTRNIRAYQDRGLLPPPEIEGRTGYYNDGHVARLRLIHRLLDQRFSLAAIGTLLSAWEGGQTLGDVLGFEEILTSPFEGAAPERVTFEELGERFGPNVEEWIDKAIELRLVVPQDDGTYFVTSPGIIEAGAVLVRYGVPLRAVIIESERLRRDTERIAERFITMFARYIWQPFLDEGRPAERLPEVAEFLEMSKPLPAMSTAALVAIAMNRMNDEQLAMVLGGEPTVPLTGAKARSKARSTRTSVSP